MDILVLIVQLLKAHRPVTKPLRNLILLIVFSYLNVTAQVNSKLSGHFGVSTVYQPPFQILYVPVGLDLIEFNPVIKLRVNSELEYEIGSKGEIIMGIGLGNAGLQANGVSLGERGNRTLGDFVFYRCHEFLVLLSKPYKHRA